jgi:periplasmic protein TonB
MEQPLHTLRAQQVSILSPTRLIALSASTLIVLGFAWALSSGLAQTLIEKLPEEIKIEIKEKIEKKEPPPPPPELKAPPPPFVPPPDIVFETPTAQTNTITTQSQVRTPPAISSPASIGKPHFCGDDYYPAISKRLGEKGRTTIGFTITAEGRVENVHIVNSSGSERLDNAAIECAKPWRYKAAIESGHPVAVQWKANVDWVLH